jgi:hypothetical protein
MRGAGDGDAALVMQPMVKWAEQAEITEVGGAAVLPVPDVVRV